jgi:hypothetical protein
LVARSAPAGLKPGMVSDNPTPISTCSAKLNPRIRGGLICQRSGDKTHCRAATLSKGKEHPRLTR